MPKIFQQFVVQKPEMLMDAVTVSPELYAQLDQNYAGFKDHTLVSAHHFTEDWPTWEKHPAGDELVLLLSGSAVFLLRTDTGDDSVELVEPGAFLIVPRDTWHTAFIRGSASLLFITPGEGTENRELPAAV